MDVAKPSPLRRWSTTLLEWAAALLVLAGLLDMLLQVGARMFAPGGAPAWTEEGVRIALVWTTFFGAAVATLHRHHIVVDMFGTASPAVRRIWDIAIALLLLLLAAALLYGAAILTELSWSNVTPSLGWPGSVYYIPLLFFAGATLVHSVSEIFSAGAALVRNAGEGGQTASSSQIAER